MSGRSIASSRRSQSSRRSGGEHAAGAVDHRRHAAASSSSRTSSRRGVGADEHGDVPGANRLLAGSAPRPRCGARSARPRRAARRRRRRGRARCGRGPNRWRRTRCRSARSMAPSQHDAHPQRGVARRALQAGILVCRGGPHPAVGDALVTEPGAGEQGVVGVDQRLVAAAVLARASHARRRSAAAVRYA